MNRNKLLLYIIGLFALSSFVSAYGFDLNVMFHPFALLNIASFYLMYYQFIDAIIYLILFLSIGQISFQKVFKDNKKEGKLVAIAVGLALTFSMILVESSSGFYLGKLAPIALIIFLVVLAILLYNLLLGLFEGENQKSISASLTYLIIYGLLVVPFGTLYQWIDQNASFLSALLALLSLAAFIFLILQSIKMFQSDDKDKDKNKKPEIDTTKTPPQGTGDTPPETSAEQPPVESDQSTSQAPATEAERIEEIMKLIKEIKEDIPIKMKESLDNVKKYQDVVIGFAQTKPEYIECLKPILNASKLDDLENGIKTVRDTINNAKKDAKDVPRNQGFIFMAMENAIWEYKLYFHLHSIFDKSESEYLSILHKYIEESPKIDNQKKLLTNKARAGMAGIDKNISKAIKLYVKHN